MEKQTTVDVIQKYFSDFSAKQIEQLQALGGLYKEWNEKINVISRKDIDALYEKHVLHSLAIAAIVDFKPGAQIVDIGTGGGFPGIPLSVFFPEVDFLLVDSIGKKIKVVNAVAEGDGLQNVTGVHSRVEELKNKKFDFAVTRAVAPLAKLWGWISPLLKEGQMSEELANGLICLKGGDLENEIKESKLQTHAWAINDMFEEEFFETKYVIYTPK